MKKDIEWLNNEVEKRIKKIKTDEVSFVGSDFFDEGYIHGMKDVQAIANQLDEPEVLSDKWIDGNAIRMIDGKENPLVVYVDNLQNLLVPKQELPVIPQFVADYLCRAKADVTLMRVLEIANTRNELPKWKKEYDWIVSNDETFARAWLDGYTVEEEPLYRARLKVITDEFIASYLRTQSSGAEDRLKALEIGSKYIHEDYRHLSEFTEDELKRLDIWDSEQWEVEELEE